MGQDPSRAGVAARGGGENAREVRGRVSRADGRRAGVVIRASFLNIFRSWRNAGHAASPKRATRSRKRSADRSRRRKSNPYRSAMSMLTFYINRAGKSLSKRQLSRLEAAKD